MPRGRRTEVDRRILAELKQMQQLSREDQAKAIEELLASLRPENLVPPRNVRTSLKGPEQQKLTNLVKALNNDWAPEVQLTEPMVLRALIKACLPILERAASDMCDYFWQGQGGEIVRLGIAPEGYIEDRLVVMVRQGLWPEDSDDDVSFED